MIQTVKKSIHVSNMTKITITIVTAIRTGDIAQAILPIIREMGEHKGHVRQEALVTRLALIAAAPWKTLYSRSVTGCR